MKIWLCDAYNTGEKNGIKNGILKERKRCAEIIRSFKGNDITKELARITKEIENE